jgi:long-chain acyl-CoA synthetase
MQAFIGYSHSYYFPRLHESDTAVIVYTSGTSGFNKGVMLSHRNLLYTARATRQNFRVSRKDMFLSTLPLSHTYEFTEGLLIPVMHGATVTYLERPPSPAVLIPACRTIRPTVMLSVPLVIEKIYRKRVQPLLEAAGNDLKLSGRRMYKQARKELDAALGDRLRFFSIGGAALAEDVEGALRKARFPYSLGYGMTEASPIITGTVPGRFPPSSVGRPLKGIKIKIVNGEVWARGPNVMQGYYGDGERTRDTLDEDGWLHTGDLGELDRKGNLYIKGRLKSLILGPSGENIYPEEIESLLAASHLVEETLVCPGDKGELVALVVLSEKAKALASGAAAAASGAAAAVGGALQELRDAVNRRLADFQRISRIEVRHEPFEKTATSKIKRYLYSEPDEATPASN